MVLDQVQTTQMQFAEVAANRYITAFTPPGLSIEAAKYPVLMAGVLASVEPSEWLSIYDHPESWGGLDRDAILAMRRRLFRFTIPVDGRAMEPSDTIKTLQTLALSVSPVALEIRSSSLPQSSLQSSGGQLPTGPSINVKSLEIVSEPEISRVAKRITEQDIPSSEAAWKLFDYEYSLDQVVRLMSVGLLGRIDSRRLVPTRGAHKAIIDGYVNRALNELRDRQIIGTCQLFSIELFNDNIAIFAEPGEPQVDYLRIERHRTGIDRGVSLEKIKNLSMDSKTAVFADSARFSAYEYLVRQKEKAHLTIFHFSRSSNNNILGSWLIRKAVRTALESNHVELESRENAINLLKSLLAPDFSIWVEENSYFDSFGGAFRIVENNTPCSL